MARNVKSLDEQVRERRLEREREQQLKRENEIRYPPDWNLSDDRRVAVDIIRMVLVETGMSRRQFHLKYFLKLLRA